jgi:hypothetical protein
MLNKLSAVLSYDTATGWQAIIGDLPPAAKLRQLVETAQPRPAARKFGSGMAISVPVSTSRWHFWVLDNVPPVSELAELLTRLQGLSTGFTALAGGGSSPEPAAASQPSRGAGILNRIASSSLQAGPLTPAALAKLGVQGLVESGAADALVLFKFKGDQIRKKWLSDQRLANRVDEIAAVVSSLRTDEPQRRHVEATSTADEDLEAALLARQANATSLSVVLPPKDQSGYGLLSFGSSATALDDLAALPELMSVVAPPKDKGQVRRWVRRGLIAATLGAAAIWLALPAPITINATGTTSAADATVAALPTEGFLKAMHVRVGDVVGQGEPIADFASPSLEEAAAQESLSVSIEDTNAQTALAENNYAAYQLATQRKAIAETKLEQIKVREAKLRMTAPAAGRIISAIPDSSTGSYQQTGTMVATIQTGPGFRLSLKLARMDASLVTPGMTGVAYFRGLGGRSYQIKVITPATVLTDPKTGAETVEAVAEVTDPDAADLIVGLSGYARLDGVTAPRIVSYSRYVVEFVRVRAWTYLGLHL